MDFQITCIKVPTRPGDYAEQSFAFDGHYVSMERMHGHQKTCSHAHIFIPESGTGHGRGVKKTGASDSRGA
jgi:hypothetical protein